MMLIAGVNKTEIASEYAKKHGIKKYKVKGNRMIHYRNDYERMITTKVTVRLDSLRVDEQKLTKWRGE